MKECIICKNKFLPIGTNQKCCSEVCSNNKIKQYLKEYKKRNKYITYLNSDKYKQERKEYKQSEDGKLANKKYSMTDKRKQVLKNYSKTNNFKQTQNRYHKTISGKYTRLLGKLRRKERLNNCIHSFTKEEWKQKCEATNGICLCCHTPFDNYSHKLSLDHIFALYWANIYFKQTGIKFVYTIDQVQPLCLSCNSSKQCRLTNGVQ
jgi:hypothetical protein